MLEVISLADGERWEARVRSFEKYDAYYLPGYAAAFRLHGDGEPLLISFDNGRLRAISVVMKRDAATAPRLKGKIPEGLYYDYSTPYGYGGFLVEGTPSAEDWAAFSQEYGEFCRRQNIVSEFVRFHPLLNNAAYLSPLYDVLPLGATVCLDLRDKETIWANLSSKNRNMVRKAQKEGVRIYWGRSPSLFSSFAAIYNETMDRDNARDYYYFQPDFYDSILNDLKEHAMIFTALKDDQIIPASILLHANGQMHYHLSASRTDCLRFAPTNLLLYEAACWGASNGYRTLHLGGGLGSQEDGLYKFKKAFNRQEDRQFAIGRKIFQPDIYRQLCALSACDKEESFFPAYRRDH